MVLRGIRISACFHSVGSLIDVWFDVPRVSIHLKPVITKTTIAALHRVFVRRSLPPYIPEGEERAAAAAAAVAAEIAAAVEEENRARELAERALAEEEAKAAAAAAAVAAAKAAEARAAALSAEAAEAAKALQAAEAEAVAAALAAASEAEALLAGDSGGGVDDEDERDDISEPAIDEGSLEECRPGGSDNGAVGVDGGGRENPHSDSMNIKGHQVSGLKILTLAIVNCIFIYGFLRGLQSFVYIPLMHSAVLRYIGTAPSWRRAKISRGRANRESPGRIRKTLGVAAVSHPPQGRLRAGGGKATDLDPDLC